MELDTTLLDCDRRIIARVLRRMYPDQRARFGVGEVLIYIPELADYHIMYSAEWSRGAGMSPRLRVKAFKD